MSEVSYQIVSAITVAISVASICSSFSIIVSWRKLRETKRNDLLHDYVMYMSISDMLLVLITGISLTNPAFNWTFMSKTPILICKIVGACLQLFAICSATFNFVIASCILLPLLRGANENQLLILKENQKIHCSIVAFFTLGVVLIPVVGNAFGFTDNSATYYGLARYECWIEKKAYFVTMTAPITFYAAFSIILLVCSMKNYECPPKLRSRLRWYTMAFVCVWLPTIIDRFYNHIFNSSSHILTYIQMISLHSIGCANGAIWYHYMKPDLDSDDGEESSTDFVDSVRSQSNKSYDSCIVDAKLNGM